MENNTVIANAKYGTITGLYTRVAYKIFSQSDGNDYLIGIHGRDQVELQGHIDKINQRRTELNLPQIVLRDAR